MNRKKHKPECSGSPKLEHLAIDINPFVITTDTEFKEDIPYLIEEFSSLEFEDDSTILTIGNTVLLFGGHTLSKNRKLIREIQPVSGTNIIRRVGTLPFYFERGRATFFNKMTYLCFSRSSENTTEHQRQLCYTRY